MLTGFYKVLKRLREIENRKVRIYQVIKNKLEEYKQITTLSKVSYAKIQIEKEQCSSTVILKIESN